MTDPVQLLDPAIEEILRDIAKDPESTLLRVDRPRELRDLSMRRQEVSARSAGWSSAERKLIECYREQVAFLLRYQYYVRFTESERYASLQELHQERSFRGIAFDERVILEEMQREAGQLRGEFPTDPTTVVVEECLGLSNAPNSAPMQLAAASLRLDPSESGRMYVGMEYMYQGALRSSLRVLHSLAEEAACPKRRGRICSFVGEAYERLGNTELCLQAMLSSYESDSNLIRSLLASLQVAVRSGNVLVARQASRFVDNRFAHDAPEILTWANRILREKARGKSRSYENKADQTRSQLRTTQGTASSRIIHAV